MNGMESSTNIFKLCPSIFIEIKKSKGLGVQMTPRNPAGYNCLVFNEDCFSLSSNLQYQNPKFPYKSISLILYINPYQGYCKGAM